MKRCSQCRETKPRSEFNKRRMSKDGLESYCRACNSLMQKRIYARDSLIRRTQVAEYAANNKELIRKNKAEYYQKNKSRLRDYYHGWHLENLDSIHAYQRERYLRRKFEYVANARRREKHIKRATPAWADFKAILTFYEEAARLTAEIGIMHHVDHEIPLRGKTVCGLHVQTNLQILTAEENKAKFNHFQEAV